MKRNVTDRVAKSETPGSDKDSLTACGTRLRSRGFRPNVGQYYLMWSIDPGDSGIRLRSRGLRPIVVLFESIDPGDSGIRLRSRGFRLIYLFANTHFGEANFWRQSAIYRLLLGACSAAQLRRVSAEGAPASSRTGWCRCQGQLFMQIMLRARRAQRSKGCLPAIAVWRESGTLLPPPHLSWRGAAE